MSTIQDTQDQIKDRINTALEVATDARDDNPVGVLERRFGMLHGRRTPFYDEAKEMAELVVPGMYEGSACGPYASSKFIFGQRSFNSPNQSLVSQGVLNLSWSMANVILPADGDYFTRNVEQSVAEQFELMEQQRQQIGGDAPDFVPIGLQVNQSMLRDDIIVRKQIASSNHQSVLAECLFHSIISGISVFGHLTKDTAKAYTFQNSVTVFDSAHNPVEVVTVDRVPLMDFSDSVRKRIIGTSDGDELTELNPDDTLVTVYTQQIRAVNGKLLIRTEIEGLPIDELSFEVPADAPVLIPLPFIFVNAHDPYPIGWLTYNRGDLFSYENGELAVEGMISAAACCILGIPPGARLTTEEIRRAPGLTALPIADAKATIQSIVAPIAANLQQVASRQEEKKRQLMIILGLDFAIQRSGERVTAEEIQRLAAGLQKLFGSTYKQLERDFQYRHVKRQFFLCQEEQLVAEVDPKTYTLSLTAGLQNQEAQNDVGKMDQLLARDAQMAQMEQTGSGSFNRVATMQWFAQKFKLDVSDKLLTPDQQAELLGIGQLFAVIRQLGPNAPGMIAQVLDQVMNGGGLQDGTQQPGA